MFSASCTLTGPATNVLTLRLKKRQAAETVTGTLVIKCTVLDRASTPTLASAGSFPRLSAHRSSWRHLTTFRRVESPLALASSPRSPWQAVPDVLPASPFASLIPPAVCDD